MGNLIGRGRYKSEAYPVARPPASTPIPPDHKVLVDASDDTPGFLFDKLIGGGGVILSVDTPGGNERVQLVAASPTTIRFWSTGELGPSGLHIPGDGTPIAYPTMAHVSKTGVFVVKIKSQFGANGIGPGTGQYFMQDSGDAGTSGVVGANSYSDLSALPQPNNICQMIVLVGYANSAGGTIAPVITHYAPGQLAGEQLIAQDLYIECMDVIATIAP